MLQKGRLVEKWWSWGSEGIIEENGAMKVIQKKRRNKVKSEWHKKWYGGEDNGEIRVMNRKNKKGKIDKINEKLMKRVIEGKK